MVWGILNTRKGILLSPQPAPPYSDLTARRGIDVTSNGLVYRSGDIYMVNGFTGPQARELRPAYIFYKKNWIDQPTGKYKYTERPSWCAAPPTPTTTVKIPPPYHEEI